MGFNLKKIKVIIFNKKGNTIKKFKFYYRGKVIQIASQYNYLGFTFVPSEKGFVGIEKLLKHGKMLSIQKMLSKSNEKTIGTYFKLVDSLVKPVIPYACECWCQSMKKEIFANKV